MKTATDEALVERATREYHRSGGTEEPCSARSVVLRSVTPYLVTLANVNGELAHYWFWPDTHRMRRVGVFVTTDM